MKHFSLADYIEDEAEVESDCSKDEEDNEECEQEPEGIDEARITGVNLVNGEELIKSLDIYYPGKYCL